MKMLIIALVLFISGCSMSNDEIISEIEKCEKAGMNAKVLIGKISRRIEAIECDPTNFIKESKE